MRAAPQAAAAQSQPSPPLQDKKCEKQGKECERHQAEKCDVGCATSVTNVYGSCASGGSSCQPAFSASAGKERDAGTVWHVTRCRMHESWFTFQLHLL
jgi:hypothetical protein